ncbi:hypothetical protein [Kordia jejudonensis]|nr:hypothetical protein [Kordia jejudonensis]
MKKRSITRISKEEKVQIVHQTIQIRGGMSGMTSETEVVEYQGNNT